MTDRSGKSRNSQQRYRLAARASGSLHVGCCGWAGSQADYFHKFCVIEVQQTFYQPPRLETLAGWRERAPPEFEFTLKAWQLITHEPTSPTYKRPKLSISQERMRRYGSFRSTEEVHAAWRTTLDCARALNGRIVLFQCPASFTPTDDHLDSHRIFLSWRIVKRVISCLRGSRAASGLMRS